MIFFFKDTATTEIYTYGHTLSLHDALPIYQTSASGMSRPFERGVIALDIRGEILGIASFEAGLFFHGLGRGIFERLAPGRVQRCAQQGVAMPRSEEHTSELQSLMRISYAVFCLQKKTHLLHQNKKHN